MILIHVFGSNLTKHSLSIRCTLGQIFFSKIEFDEILVWIFAQKKHLRKWIFEFMRKPLEKSTYWSKFNLLTKTWSCCSGNSFKLANIFAIFCNCYGNTYPELPWYSFCVAFSLKKLWWFFGWFKDMSKVNICRFRKM